MSLSQSYPQGYPSMLYPPSGSQYQQTILPAVSPNTLGGNAADYMSKAVGGSRRRSKGTIIRWPKKTRRYKGRGKKSRTNRRRRSIHH